LGHHNCIVSNALGILEAPVTYISAVTAVTAVGMKSPWFCPYCEQTSQRRWNLSTHIQRKHPGSYNPLPEMKRVTHLQRKHPGSYNPLPEMKRVIVFDSYSAKAMHESWNSFSPPNDWFDPAPIFEKSTKYQNILQEIKQFNKIERFFLLYAINNLPYFKNYSKSLF
jgi:hypothetical protein